MEDKIRYEYIDEFIRETIKPYKGLLKEMKIYANERHIPIVQIEVAKLLEVLGSLIRPQRILEVGTAIGYSTIILARLLKNNGKLDTIEISEEMTILAKENIIKSGLKDKVNIIYGDAREVLMCLDNKYDIIFLDASKGQYIEFFSECIRMLRPGGLLISDNILYRGLACKEGFIEHKHRTIAVRLKEYINLLCKHPMLNTSIIPIGDGVALSYKEELV